MGKTTKAGRLREKTLADVQLSKQTTFDSLPVEREKPTEKADLSHIKRILITEVCSETKEDDLELKVGFRLIPSKSSFSRVVEELFFDGQKLNSCVVRIPQGPLSTDDLELPVSSLDMKGIIAGQHVIRVEMYELWNSKEKLSCTSKEVTVNYVPVRRQDRYIKIPIVKNLSTEIDVILGSEKRLYEEMGKDLEKERVGKRDEW